MPKARSAQETALQIRRTFLAARDRVFRAWTDPVELARWFAPTADHSTVVPRLDLRVGGEYRLELHHKGGNVHRLAGTYREIKPPEKLVFTWRWEEDPTAHESLVTVEFHDRGNATEIVLTHENLPDTEQREKHSHGWDGCLARLSQYFQA